MSKKIISIFLVFAVVFALFATSISASALVDTNITYGDYNGDGKITINDVSDVLKVCALLESIEDEKTFKRCDINSDGEITIYDARQILRSIAGLTTIQPAGEFAGFDGGGAVANAEDAVNYFNTALNRIKTEKPGFSRSDDVEVAGFKIGGVSLSGFDVGETAQSVSNTIEKMLIKESEPEPYADALKGENCDNVMSVEAESYVSQLSADEVLGVRCVKDSENGVLTIEIALPDCELDDVSQNAIGDVLSPKILQENMNTVVGNVFGASDGGDTTRKTIKNCLLTAEFDTSNGNVISYKTTYITETYITKSTVGLKGGILSAELSDVNYQTSVTVIYDSFQW